MHWSTSTETFGNVNEIIKFLVVGGFLLDACWVSTQTTHVNISDPVLDLWTIRVINHHVIETEDTSLGAHWNHLHDVDLLWELGELSSFVEDLDDVLSYSE